MSFAVERCFRLKEKKKAENTKIALKSLRNLINCFFLFQIKINDG